MAALADRPELVGFFSYSREDDNDSRGRLSQLRDRIQRELRSQLGKSTRNFRLWQDKEAIAPGTLWKLEIEKAVGQSVFFVPIVTPTAVTSPYCKIEFDLFLARERMLGHDDLVFPILYIRVPALEDSERRRANPVLSIIAERQYVDWRELRHLDVNSTPVLERVEHFCSKIADALTRPDRLETEREQRRKEEAEQREAEEAARLRRREEEERRQPEEQERRRQAGEERRDEEQPAKEPERPLTDSPLGGHPPEPHTETVAGSPSTEKRHPHQPERPRLPAGLFAALASVIAFLALAVEVGAYLLSGN